MSEQKFYIEARRKWRLAAIACVLLLMVLAALFATRQIVRDKPPADAATSSAQLTRPDARAVRAAPFDAPPETQNVAPRPRTPRDELYAEIIRGAGLTPDCKLDLCGFGRIRVGDIADPQLLSGSFRQRRDAFVALIGALRKSAHEIDQALAAHLASMLDGETVAEKFSLDRPECAGQYTGPCSTYELSRSARAAALQPLIDIAVKTSDPNVYALAHGECRLAPKSTPGCAAITARRWAELDPDNAAPRLILAAEKSRKQDGAWGAADTTATDQLYAEAAARRRYSMRVPPYQRVMALPEFTALPLIVQQSIVVPILGERAAYDIGTTQPIAQYCLRKAPEMYPQRVPVCAQFAELLDQQATDLYSLGLTALIGEGAGWPPEKRQARQDEYQQIANLMMENAFSEDMFSCNAIQRNIARTQQVIEIGELPTYRAIRESKLAAEARSAEQKKR
jgi:hypothetical protein